MNIQKNNTLELLKLFASYMVVFIHVLFCGRLGVIFDTLARFAVPFFFLVSGFFSYKITTEKIKKRILHILTLLILASVCYTIFNIAKLLLKGDINDIILYFSKYADFTVLAKFFIFNVPVSSDHLWYLLAMVYVYIVFYFVTMFRLHEKVIFIVSFSLLFLHILLGECLSALGIVVPIHIVRNFALMGIPFFALGLFVKKHENHMRAIPNYLIIISTIIGVFESIFSRYFFGKNELYIGSLFILFTMVCVFIKYSSIQYPHFLLALEGCSTYVYIFHLIISSVITAAYSYFGANTQSSLIIFKNIRPILVCIVSTIFAFCITQLIKKIQHKK